MMIRNAIVGALLLVPLCTGCKVTDIATPEQRQVIEQFDRQIAQEEATAKELQADVERLSAALYSSAKSQDADRVLEIADDLAEANQAFLTASRQVLETIDEAQAYDNSIIEGKFSPWLQVLAGFIPAPAQPLLPFTIPILGLAFDRPRKNLAKALRSIFKSTVSETAKSLGAVLGWAHTSTATATVAASEDLYEKQQKLRNS